MFWDKNCLLKKCDVIWENINEVGKCDFEIFIESHREEDEEYSENKNCLKNSILCRGMAFQRSNLQKASFEKKMFENYLSQRVENNFCKL